MVLFLGKGIIFKNYAGWNNTGMNLRIGYGFFQGNNINFSGVRNVDVTDDILIIKRILKEKVEINLNEIRKSDSKRLHQILMDNTPDRRS